MKASGWIDNTPDGRKLEIQTLTNLRTGRSVEKDSAPSPDSRRPGAEKASTREQRIQELDEQLQQIQKDLERLRLER